MATSAPTAPRVPLLRNPGFWLFGVVAVAIGARAWLHFRTALVPGINGAYYLVQARSLLEHGHLGIPDLPVTFWLQAALARLIELITRLPQDTAIVWAVKLSDSVLPPLAALPVFWLSSRWSRTGEPLHPIVLVVPAAVVALGTAMLDMTGNFQKNALALVWFAALAPAMFAFLDRPTLRSMAGALLLLALLGLTHIGVLGAALVFCGTLAVVALVTADRTARRQILLLILLGLGVLGIAGGLAYRLYDPARITRLVTAIESPATIAGSRGPGAPPGAPPGSTAPTGDHNPPPPPDMDFAGTGGPDFALRMPQPPDLGGQPPERPQGNPGPGAGKPGGPGELFPRGITVTLAGLALWLAWRQRRRLSPAEFSTVAAAAITALALALPLQDDQKAERLLGIATIPAAIAGSFVLTRIVIKGWSNLIAVCAAVFLLGDSAMRLSLGERPVISDNTFAELMALQPQCSDPEHTLVVAHHGLEWWAAWILHTHIAQPRAVSADDWATFTRVLYLQEKGRSGPPGAGPQDHPAPGGAGPGPGGPDDTSIPDGAQMLHDGTTLTLARVESAPTTRRPFGPPPQFGR